MNFPCCYYVRYFRPWERVPTANYASLTIRENKLFTGGFLFSQYMKLGLRLMNAYLATPTYRLKIAVKCRRSLYWSGRTTRDSSLFGLPLHGVPTAAALSSNVPCVCISSLLCHTLLLDSVIAGRRVQRSCMTRVANYNVVQEDKLHSPPCSPYPDPQDVMMIKAQDGCSSIPEAASILIV
jgi:hypothetical protein